MLSNEVNDELISRYLILTVIIIIISYEYSEIIVYLLNKAWFNHFNVMYLRRDMMYDALLRPGRLEGQIEIGLPKVPILFGMIYERFLAN